MIAAKKAEAAVAGGDGRADAAEPELARQLAERAQSEGLALTGPGGLLGRLTKVVLEGALEGEMDAHLGYAKHDPAGRDGGNSRNGHRAKTAAAVQRAYTRPVAHTARTVRRPQPATVTSCALGINPGLSQRQAAMPSVQRST